MKHKILIIERCPAVGPVPPMVRAVHGGVVYGAVSCRTPAEEQKAIVRLKKDAALHGFTHFDLAGF